jgi:glutathione S-transferase
MLELFIANKNYSSWSLRPWVLMRELDIPFIEKLTPFGGKTEPNPFLSFSPSGKVPCLHDGTTVVWDSLAITEYLAERTPKVWPTEPSARNWARCAAAEMHSEFRALRRYFSMNCGIRVQLNEYPLALEKDLARLDELWNEGLTRFGGPYLAGEAFTAVDAFFAPVAFRVQTYAPVMSANAHLYVNHLLLLPSMQDWYASAIAEIWREEDHENEMRKTGTWLQDYRATAV